MKSRTSSIAMMAGLAAAYGFAGVAAGQGTTGTYFLSTGNNRILYKCQGTAVSASGAHDGSSGYNAAMSVLTSVRLLGLDPGVISGEYDFNCAYTGTNYSNTAPSGRYGDGTTDGTKNYASSYTTNTVYQFDLDWTNPVALFSIPAETVVGITYDPSDDTFYLSAFGTSNVFHYSKTGTLLGTWSTGHTGNVGLAMDYADGTLWILNRNTYTYEQYKKDGTVMQTGVTFSGMGASENNLGGEFPLGDPPPPPPPPCYADCDGNGRLDIRDFFCFQAQYAAGCP